jgi:hypothetical protein
MKLSHEHRGPEIGERGRTYKPTTGHIAPWSLALSLVLGVSCQQLDSNLTSGRVSSTAGSGGTGQGAGSGGDVGSDGPQASCNTARMEARAILLLNCSGCHQDPMKQMSINSGGPFAFILELDKLTTMTSPTFIGRHYVVQGDPASSLIHSRYSPGGGMPPASVTQRPSPADLMVLDDWITRCINDPDSPGGWPPFVVTDGGTSVDAGASPLPACGPANVCPGGGCCVFGQCVPSGSACGPLANPTPGMQDLPGLPGTCTAGSCQKVGDGGVSVSCGKVGEPCCDLSLCTASQSSCLITDMTMCSQCGGTGEPCCKPNGCLDGRTCTNGGVGRVGTCQICGGLGQPCCGAGVAALQKCNGGLGCVTVSGMGNVCLADGGSDDGASGQ